MTACAFVEVCMGMRRTFNRAGRVVGVALAAVALSACASTTEEVTTGALIVNVFGLPDGTEAAIVVSGTGLDVDEALGGTATLTNIPAGTYSVLSSDVVVGIDTYSPTPEEGSATVTAGAETAFTVVYSSAGNGVAPGAFADNDAESNPGLFAQFRNTSPAPVWVSTMLFNAANPIDTKGIQLRNEIGTDDPADWLQFSLVHGQSPTTSISVSLACSGETSGVRAEVRDVTANVLRSTILCNETKAVVLPNSGGATSHRVKVFNLFDNDFYTEYILSINAYCFRGCNYQPYVE
jgi:hypothetical protein